MAAGLFGMTRMPKREREETPNPIVGMYKTSDGRFLSLVMLESDRYWGDLVTLLGAPELEHDPRFVDSTARRENAAECVHALDDLFAKKTFEEWKTILQDAKGVWAPVQNAGELLEDPQAIANGYVREVEAASGTMFKMIASPLQFDETAPDLTRGPEHGEHTDEVLGELGLDMDELLELKIKGAIL
jgi:crotonobetainyl-CoA:carnitine CoA-transferase CaiB-like acyl-CoA transferase